jgi:hypothetical protein
VVKPTFGRITSALVATTLDLAQKTIDKANIVAAIAKLAFLRMGASDPPSSTAAGESEANPLLSNGV